MAPGSDCGFGLVLAAFFALIGAFKLWHGHAVGGVWCMAGLAFFVLVVVRPKVLAPLNHFWLKLGLLLYKVANPLVMVLMFYLTILPIGLLMRLIRKDPLSLKRDPQARDYWTRLAARTAPKTMHNRFSKELC